MLFKYYHYLMDAFILFELNILDSLSVFYCDAMDKLMIFFSEIGGIGLVWIVITLILLIIKKYRKAGFTAALALVLGLIVCNLLLKNIIMRDRPFELTDVELLIDTPGDHSFPSGHATSSFAAATALFMANKKFGIFAWPVAALTAFSRMYLYVHFPSDILAGALLGVGMAFLARYITNKLPIFKGYNSIRRE